MEPTDLNIIFIRVIYVCNIYGVQKKLSII
jgi:hypothetical protein